MGATCTHANTKGQANDAGAIVFTCLNCQSVVKIIYQPGGLKLPSSRHPITWDAPKKPKARLVGNLDSYIQSTKTTGIWDGADASGKETVKPKPLLLMKPIAPMKNGDVRKLPHISSPLWTTQWSVQGTAKSPYIVSRSGHVNGATTAEGWACSCPNFTQHSPRTECKHVLKVMLAEGVKPQTPPVAALPDEQQAAFQKFLRQQAAAGTPAIPATGKAKDLFPKGRRFR